MPFRRNFAGFLDLGGQADTVFKLIINLLQIYISKNF